MEDTKPLLFKGDANNNNNNNNNSRWRKNALVSTALLALLVTFTGVHFLSSAESSSFALRMGSSKGRLEDQKMKPIVSKEAKLGEKENDEGASDDEDSENNEVSDVPKPANNEETKVVDTEDDGKVDELIEEEKQLAEKVDVEITDWRKDVEEQHEKIEDAVKVLRAVSKSAKGTEMVDGAVANVHTAQGLIKEAISAPPKIEKESEKIDEITEEIEEEVDNADAVSSSSSSTLTPEEAEVKMQELREHVAEVQAKITQACDAIATAKAAIIDGSLGKEEGLKQIGENADIVDSSEASVYEKFHSVTKETESEPEASTEAPTSSSSENENNDNE